MLWLTHLQQPNLCITLLGLSCIMLRHLAKKLTNRFTFFAGCQVMQGLR